MHEFPPSAIATWGASVIFANVLLTRLGVPVPAVPILVLAGTAIAGHTLAFWPAFLCAVAGALLGDAVWFVIGRRYGERVFDALAKLSPPVEFALRKTRALFERFGVSITAVSKFVPGLAFITPPLMGTIRVDARIYAAWDVASATSWAAFWLFGGVLVEKQLGLLLAIVRAHDATLFDVLGAILAGYLVLRLLHRWRVRRWLVRMRRAAASVGAAHPAFALPVIFDARPQTLRNPAAQRIERARPLDTASAATVDEALGTEAGVVYCVCPDHATARDIVGKMRAKGYTRIRTIRGDLDAWRRRGYPIRMDTPTSSDASKPSALPHGHEPLTVRCVVPRRPR